MRVQLVSTPNGITTVQGAKRYCQDFARICYTKRSYDEVKGEEYNPDLVEGRLINTGHHSVFDHFNMGLYIDGLPKVMAMVLNNEPPYATAEKSARYTVMEDMIPEQKRIYDQWMSIFSGLINRVYPDGISDREEKIKKLAQENARGVTSVFTPTKMGYTLSLRQLNILANLFERVVPVYENGEDEFFRRLAAEGLKPFLESDVVNNFRIPGLETKAEPKLKLFGHQVEEHFGEDIYATNLKMSFACLAQNHRHRTIHNHIFGGWQKGAPLGYFIPPIIQSDRGLVDAWVSDLKKVSETDFPQAQLVGVAERGNREDLEMKLGERNCGLAQLEIVRVMDGLLEKYEKQVPEIGKLRGATCITSGKGCKKGGCAFGPEKAVSRLI